VVGFLAVDADVADPAAVGFNKLLRLDEHSTGTAAGVIYTAFIRSQHFNEELNHATGRVELTALFPLGAGELRKEVLVDTAENIFGAVCLIAQADVANQVDELAEALLIEARVGIVFGKHALE